MLAKKCAQGQQRKMKLRTNGENGEEGRFQRQKFLMAAKIKTLGSFSILKPEGHACRCSLVDRKKGMRVESLLADEDAL